jgi:hypothetical protein
MTSFKINFSGTDRDEVVRFLKQQSNDIIIDKIEDFSVGITIERDDAEEFYQELLERIDHQIYHSKNSDQF